MLTKKTAEKKNCSKEALLRPELSGWRSNSITSGLSLILVIKTRIEVSAGKQGGIIMKKGSLLQLHLDFSRTVLKLQWKSGRRKLLAKPS